jgi:hypothetical protein
MSVMSYLLIRQNEAKKFKSFLSGKEIEVSVVMSPSANIFRKGDEVEIFYGNDNCDTYRAKVTRQHKECSNTQNKNQLLVMLGLVKQ